MAELRAVEGDVLVALLDEGADPHADVDRHDVGEAEAGDELELVDVQLRMRETNQEL